VADDLTVQPRAFQALAALEELAELVAAARGVPMSTSCVVPRGHVLDLIENVRDALPAELADAQRVLDRRDDLLSRAQERLAAAARRGEAEGERLVSAARDQAAGVVRSAKEHGSQHVGAAQAQAERILAAAHAEAETAVAAARHEASRLVEASEVHQAAAAEAERIMTQARSEAKQMAADVEEYVDSRLASLSELVTRIMRQVDVGRRTLRERAAAPGKAAAGRAAESTDPRRLG
jgi:cell division septum initiation protein DivIVA